MEEYRRGRETNGRTGRDMDGASGRKLAATNGMGRRSGEKLGGGERGLGVVLRESGGHLSRGFRW